MEEVAQACPQTLNPTKNTLARGGASAFIDNDTVMGMAGGKARTCLEHNGWMRCIHCCSTRQVA